MSGAFKTLLRVTLGITAYRILTQTPRYVRFLTKPKYEPEMALLAALIGPEDVCFDVGANYGQYTRQIEPLLTSGKLYSFEPSRINRFGLLSTVKLLGLKRTVVLGCALADKQGQETLHIPVKSHGGLGIALAHIGTPTHAETITEIIEVTTLDQLMELYNIPRCDFIKCDAEGCEFKVLLGARETLKQHRPVLVMEVADAYLKRNGHSRSDIEAFVAELNYASFVLRGGKLARVETLVEGDNHFFLPQEKLANFGVIMADTRPLQAA